MEANIVGLKIALAFGGVICDRKAVMFDLAFPKDQIELCSNKMLQHSSNIRRTAGVLLQFQCLVQKGP